MNQVTDEAHIEAYNRIKEHLITDNKGPVRFKPYDLKKVNADKETDLPVNFSFFEGIRKQRKKRREDRFLKQEGIDEKNIIRVKRERKLKVEPVKKKIRV